MKITLTLFSLLFCLIMLEVVTQRFSEYSISQTEAFWLPLIARRLKIAGDTMPIFIIFGSTIPFAGKLASSKTYR